MHWQFVLWGMLSDSSFLACGMGTCCGRSPCRLVLMPQ